MGGAEGFEPPTLWSQSTPRTFEPNATIFYSVRESSFYKGFLDLMVTLICHPLIVRVPTVVPTVLVYSVLGVL
jgi:hypothetical protein